MSDIINHVKDHAYLYLYRFILASCLVISYIYFYKLHFIVTIFIILCIPGMFVKYIVYFGRQDEYKNSKNKRFFWAFELARFIWNGFRNL